LQRQLVQVQADLEAERSTSRELRAAVCELQAQAPSTLGYKAHPGAHFCVMSRCSKELRQWLRVGPTLDAGRWRSVVSAALRVISGGNCNDSAWPTDIRTSILIGNDELHLTRHVQTLLLSAVQQVGNQHGQRESPTMRCRDANREPHALLSAFEHILWDYGCRQHQASGLTWNLGSPVSLACTSYLSAVLEGLGRITSSSPVDALALVFMCSSSCACQSDVTYLRLLQLGVTKSSSCSRLYILLDDSDVFEDRASLDAIVEHLQRKMRVVKVSLLGSEVPPSFQLSCEQTAGYLASQWRAGNLQRAADGALAFLSRSCPLTPEFANSKAMTTPATLSTSAFDVRLMSKCSRVVQDSEIAPGSSCCLRCPCCRLEVMLELRINDPQAESTSEGNEPSKLLQRAEMQLSSRRAEGKVFTARIGESGCDLFCPACRRPVTVAIGPTARRFQPLDRQTAHTRIKRRWCLSVETRRRRRRILDGDSNVAAPSPCHEAGEGNEP